MTENKMRELPEDEQIEKAAGGAYSCDMKNAAYKTIIPDPVIPDAVTAIIGPGLGMIWRKFN